MENSAPNQFKAFFFILLAGLFLLLEMSLQMSVSVIIPELMIDLKITAAGVGVISSFFFVSYTIMQIPSGIFFDCVSSRKIISFGLLLCALGTLCFASSNGVFLSSLGRFLMGLGSSFAFASVLYTGFQWFHPKYFSVITGAAMVLASLGAMGGQMPLAYMVKSLGWRESLYLLCIIGFALSILVFIFMKDKQEKAKFKFSTLYTVLKELLELLKIGRTWSIMIFGFAIWAPITAFAALWGVPFLEKAYSLSVEQASFLCSLIWIGVAIGSPLFGWWSEKIKNRLFPLKAGSILGLVISVLLIYFQINEFLLYIALILFGISASGQSLIFAVMKDVTDKKLIGTGIGLVNMAVVASGLVFQPLIGFLLKCFNNSAVQTATNAVNYSISDYRYALMAIPVIFAVSLIVTIFFIKETYTDSEK